MLGCSARGQSSLFSFRRVGSALLTSPVIMELLTVDSPLITTLSMGTLAPGITLQMSPICRLCAETSLGSSSTSRQSRADCGCSLTNLPEMTSPRSIR